MIIVGAGPAGYCAALELIELGIKPVVLERGPAVEIRRKSIPRLLRHGQVDPDANYCFGEGGAGAFSDGKLYTRSQKRGDIGRLLQNDFLKVEVCDDTKEVELSGALKNVISFIQDRCFRLNITQRSKTTPQGFAD